MRGKTSPGISASVTEQSRLIRWALRLLVLCAVVAAVALISEWYRFAQTMPNRGWNAQAFRLVGLVLTNLIFSAVLAIVVVLYLWGRVASSLPALQGWHRQKPESEFNASDAIDGFKLDDYFRKEEQVFRELDDLIVGPWATQSPGAYSRYHTESVCNPETIVERNWNRSYVLRASNPIGGVLLLHGLSDSPYSLRALGERLHAEGYTVIWLRLPGHGTNPRALADLSWKDWAAAVEIAVRGLRDQLPAGVPLILGGYSNGGALSVDYSLSAIEDASLAKPDAVVLFSPMIGINPMARITRLYHMVARVTGNMKAQWSSVQAEIDPFKYSSWPMNANVQAWAVTQSVERKLARLQKSRQLNEMPPVLAMQSVVDSTVVVPKLITVLFDRLSSELSELVLFDINRADWLGNLFRLSFEQKIIPKLKRTDLPYQLTFVSNMQTSSEQVRVQTRDGESWKELEANLSWPDGIVSLSHVAVPIPPDDRIYGTAEATKDTGLSLGSISMRGEPAALLISDSVFVRCRHNPFYQYMEDHVVGWLTEVLGRRERASEGKG